MDVWKDGFSVHKKYGTGWMERRCGVGWWWCQSCENSFDAKKLGWKEGWMDGEAGLRVKNNGNYSKFQFDNIC